MKKWFVMRSKNSGDLTRKRKMDIIEASGMEYYIPVLKQIVKDEEKKKKIGVVMKTLLPNIIFIHADEETELKPFMKNYPYVLMYCNVGNKHMMVSETEMSTFIVACQNYNDSLMIVEPDDISRKLGKRVKIIDGPLSGHEGLLVKVKGKRAKQVVIELQDIIAVSISIAPECLQFID